jgi:hypothetical protein
MPMIKETKKASRKQLTYKMLEAIAGVSYKDQEIPDFWQTMPEIGGTFVTIWTLPKHVTIYPQKI